MNEPEKVPARGGRPRLVDGPAVAVSARLDRPLLARLYEIQQRLGEDATTSDALKWAVMWARLPG